MGILKDGKWYSDESGFADDDGAFKRTTSKFRSWVTKDGSPGPSGEGGFKAEAGRYHLYVSYACPWAHRTLIMRSLKGLDDMIGLSATHWIMRERGWTFDDGPGVIPDPLMNADTIHEIYQAADPKVSGKATVPVLWDKQTKTIVSNESAEIIRMFNSAFDEIGAREGDYYPDALQAEIDDVNDRVYDTVNNGVYKAGFAEQAGPYEEAFDALFESLDWLEARLSQQIWLVGDQMTEADIRLFTTLLRFDPIYHNHFKCNKYKIREKTALQSYLARMIAIPEIRGTINMDHAKGHYYQSHLFINPTGIVPKGPEIPELGAE